MTGTWKIAVTTGCMNRMDPLAKSLPTWLALPEANHVVVVDWSSAWPLRHPDPRVLVVRVSGQKYWRNSWCHNLEMEVARELGCELSLRVDADVTVGKDFFAKHPARDGVFYAVNCHEVPPKLEHKKSLCGTVYARVSDLLAVNGYNERLCQYGYEDEDLYKRLEASGLAWKRCDLDTLEHIPHSDASRVENVDTKDAPATTAKAGPKMVAEHYIYRSLALARAQPWGPGDQRTKWRLTRAEPNYWEAVPCS